MAGPCTTFWNHCVAIYITTLYCTVVVVRVLRVVAMCCIFDRLYPFVRLCVLMLFAGSLLPLCSDQYVMSKKNRDAIAEAVRLGYCFRFLFSFVFNNGYVIVENREFLQLLLLSSVYQYYYFKFKCMISITTYFTDLEPMWKNLERWKECSFHVSKP